ncbi:ATP-binding protein [Ammoniphilus sp. YIM 78166]|uniref:ATP-binding protein n=1 Tax=Ammoniphilus sp. YIM 78166 TaxID=1644106 RepID=UPI00142F9426|nr:ATP-binding protein [Ammoniphilus sp. YIM 78166]
MSWGKMTVLVMVSQGVSAAICLLYAHAHFKLGKEILDTFLLFGALAIITYIFLTKERLKQSEQRYRWLVENIPVAVCIHRDDKFVYVNQAGLELSGLSNKDGIIGKSIWETVHPSQREETFVRLLRCKEGNEEIVGEHQYIRPDGSIVETEIRSIPIMYEGKPSILTVARDITQMKRTMECFSRSEKLSVVGQLAAGVAHEIRNPLTTLKGFIQFFRSKLGEKYAQIMLSELDRINLIVSEFLVLAKPQGYSFRMNDLKQIIEDVVVLFEAQANLKNVQMKTCYPEGSFLVGCEANQLKQVFINLFKNAIEAMPGGGKLTIELTETEGQQVSVVVADEGVGIPESEIHRLGEPFFTTKEEGTGLGLVISYKIVENHGGQMMIHSQPQQGTSVVVLLPLAVPSSVVTTVNPRNLSSEYQSKKSL